MTNPKEVDKEVEDVDPPIKGIVAAVGTATRSPRGLGPAVEAAMRRAVEEASADGLNVDTDADEVRERMAVARKKVTDEFNARAAKELAEKQAADAKVVAATGMASGKGQ